MHVGDVAIGNDLPFVLIAGPCQIEAAAHALEVAAALAEIAARGRRRADLQEQLRQGQPHLRSPPRAASAWRRACAILAEVRERLGCRC